MATRVINWSGGYSLYHRRPITVEIRDGETVLSRQINEELKVEVTYDSHATGRFTMDQILDDFWATAAQICGQEGFKLNGEELP